MAKSYRKTNKNGLSTKMPAPLDATYLYSTKVQTRKQYK